LAQMRNVGSNPKILC